MAVFLACFKGEDGCMKITVNMRSAADMVEGQGVLSAYREQVGLIQNDLKNSYEVFINRRHMKADITHYHTINPTYFMELPFVKQYGTTVGYVHFLPETVDESLHLIKPARKIFYSYMLRFYKSMDHLVVVNPYFIDRLEAYGVSRSKVTAIPNFVSEEKFYPVDDNQKKAFREKYNIPQDAFVVLCAGQLQRRKGFFDFIKVASQLPMHFVWAGDFAFGAISDGYTEIQKIVKHPPKNVTFTGLIPRKDMNELYNLCDVMFLPAYEELFPMTVLEAMNCRKPLVLRDVDLYKNILFDFYEKGTNNEEFCALLSRLKEDPDFYEQAAQNSWRGHIYYSREHVASMWDAFYRSIVNTPVRKRMKRK